MKYVVYFENSCTSDSLISYSKEQTEREVADLLQDSYKIIRICRIVKGEYVPIDIKPYLQFSLDYAWTAGK